MENVEQWDVAEVALEAPGIGDPWAGDALRVVFAQDHRRVAVDGFFDGNDTFRARFMPDTAGPWTWRSESVHASLDGHEGTFTVMPPEAGNRGPVRVRPPFDFAYADGSPFSNVGTTCYGWVHQPDERFAQTLATLRDGPFNKIRMCVMPKHYRYNENEPPAYPFRLLAAGESRWQGSPKGESDKGWDFAWDEPQPAFFQRLDRAVQELCALGIEADIILFHPYDRWGFARLPGEVEDRILRHLVARLAAYRNVWWSFANEWDLMDHFSIDDWERHAATVCRHDPYGRLTGIHNCRRNYDHHRPWITHVSFQGHPDRVPELRRDYGKPVVVDECRYEGDIAEGWGNLTADGLVDRFWIALRNGGFCGHGECLYTDDEVLWWGKGSVLRGESPPRLRFLRDHAEAHGGGVYTPCGGNWAKRNGDSEFLFYPGEARPREVIFTFPGEADYRLECVDVWNCTIEPLPLTGRGRTVIPMPARRYVGLRALRQD